MQGWPMMGGGGGIGMLLQMLLQGGVHSMMGSANMMPMGVSHQNLYDRFQARHFTQQHNEMIQSLAQRDRAGMMQFWQGTANAFGQPWGDAQFRAANNLASAQIMATPVLMELAPMALDTMMGNRGSQAVMGHYMMRGGRSYADPVTGRWGLNAEGATDLTTRVYDRLLSNKGLRESYGLSAGESGQLFWALNRQGMMRRGDLESLETEDPGFMRKALQDVDLDKAGGVRNLRSGDRELLLDQPAMQERLKSFNAKRVASTLKDWSGSIHALREVFGDAGMPNAPLPMLLASLEQLTSGAMTQFAPGRVQNMVRNTANLAKLSGVGMEGAMMMQQVAAPMAAQLGLNPVFTNYATQNMMAFTAGYKAEGIGGYQAWGAPSLAQAQQAEMQFQLGAAGSQAANQIGLMFRLQKMGTLQAGSNASRYLGAVQLGATQFTDAAGNTRSLDMGVDDFSRMIGNSTGGQIGAGYAMSMLSQTSANQEHLALNPVGLRVVRRLQPGDYATEAGISMGEAASVALASKFGKSMSPDDTGVLGRVLGMAGQRAFYKGNVSTAMNNERLFSSMGVQMEASLNRLVDADPNNLRPETASARRILGELQDDPNMLQTMSGSAFGQWNQRLIETQRGTARQNWVAMNDQVLQSSSRATAQSQLDTNYQKALGPFGGRSILRRAFEATMNAKPGSKDTLTKIISEMAGGEPKEKMMQALAPELAKMQELAATYKKISTRIMTEPDGDERARMWTEAESINRAVTETSDKIVQVFRANGIDAAPEMDPGSLAKWREFSTKISGMVKGKEDVTEATLGRAVFSDERANARNLLAKYYSSPNAAGKMGQKGLRAVQRIEALMDAQDQLGTQSGGLTAQQLGETGNQRFHGMRTQMLGRMDIVGKALNSSRMNDLPQGVQDELEKVAEATGRSVEDLILFNPDSKVDNDDLKAMLGKTKLDPNTAMAAIRQAYNARQSFNLDFGASAEAYLNKGTMTAKGLVEAAGGDFDVFKTNKLWAAMKGDLSSNSARGRGLRSAMVDIQKGLEGWKGLGAKEQARYRDQYGPGIVGMLDQDQMPSEKALADALEVVRQDIPEARGEGDPDNEINITVTAKSIVINADADGGAELNAEGKGGIVP